MVDFTCLLFSEPGAGTRLVETHHDLEGPGPRERIHGRVVEIEVVHQDGSTRPVLRVPDGSALCGSGEDDGHREDPWTGEVVTSPRNDFLVTVRMPGRRAPDPSTVYRT